MTETWARAALWLGLALVATVLSIRLGVATALSEIVVGTVAQMLIGVFVGKSLLGTTDAWVTFLSGTGAIMLTFLAGAELDPAGVRYTRNLTAIWCLFFILNASAALYTALAGSRETWAVYNGLVSYVIAGALLLGERLIRPILRRHQSGVVGR